jgi:hypothetical protein
LSKRTNLTKRLATLNFQLHLLREEQNEGAEWVGGWMDGWMDGWIGEGGK